MDGKFIVFEGPDGAGKTSVASHVAKAFEMSGYKVLHTREPGGIKAAEDIRKILKGYKLNSIQQTMLFMASMNMNIKQIIVPAMKEGKLVICDRYLRSTYIYQGYSEIGELMETIARKRWFYKLTQWACDGLLPDCEIVLDVDPDVAWKRTHSRGEELDAIEFEGKTFLDHINERYKATFKNIAKWNYPQYQLNNTDTDMKMIVYLSIEKILEGIGAEKPMQEAERIFQLYKENIK